MSWLKKIAAPLICFYWESALVYHKEVQRIKAMEHRSERDLIKAQRGLIAIQKKEIRLLEAEIRLLEAERK